MENIQTDTNKINVRFIIDKIITWPFITLIIFLILLCPIKNLLHKTEQIKLGDFELSVTEIAKSFGISNIIQDINDLSYDELKLFLIVGGEDANYYIFTPKNIPHERLVQMYEKLSNKGLIELIDPKTITGYDKMNIDAGFGFKTTEKGEKVHRAILDAIYTNLVQGKIEKK